MYDRFIMKKIVLPPLPRENDLFSNYFRGPLMIQSAPGHPHARCPDVL